MSKFDGEKKLNIDTDEVYRLAKILKKMDLTEIKYECSSYKLYLSKKVSNNVLTKSLMEHKNDIGLSDSSVSESHQFSESLKLTNRHTLKHTDMQGQKSLTQLGIMCKLNDDYDDHPGLVRSPIVGTAYLSPEPGSEPFIKVGDEVKEGQTILIVESMKVMNQIRSTRSGKVIKIFVQNNKPVEYDEQLVVIE